MMYQAVCPKCGCTEIYRINGSTNSYNGYIMLSVFQSIPLHRYICVGCGYVEEWIDPCDRPKLRYSNKALRVGQPSQH